MDYLISMLEGIATFISPCLLPLLPVYISYFMGGSDNKKRAVTNALGFILGFTLVFMILGTVAGGLSRILIRYTLWINLISGGIVILFGLSYLGVLNLRFLKNTERIDYRPSNPGFLSSLLFGIVFSISWTPCTGVFLGSALALAAASQSKITGLLMLLAYSIGLGAPFFASALLLDRLKGTFDFIKKHYRVVNAISGIMLILIGIAMMTGLMGRVIASLS
jgi:cytochrome c-type biogenesis protein